MNELEFDRSIHSLACKLAIAYLCTDVDGDLVEADDMHISRSSGIHSIIGPYNGKKKKLREGEMKSKEMIISVADCGRTENSTGKATAHRPKSVSSPFSQHSASATLAPLSSTQRSRPTILIMLPLS